MTLEENEPVCQSGQLIVCNVVGSIESCQNIGDLDMSLLCIEVISVDAKDSCSPPLWMNSQDMFYSYIPFSLHIHIYPTNCHVRRTGLAEPW